MTAIYSETLIYRYALMSGRFTKVSECYWTKPKWAGNYEIPMKEDLANLARVNLMAPNLVGI